jgi:hypothetical protein
MQNIKSSKRLIFIQLNEVNFDIVSQYIKKYPGIFNNLKKILDSIIDTTSENKYEYLEPWIQWVSVYTGLKYSEHEVFRLGDISKLKTPQIFELIEELGLTVGAISPMNAENRLMSPSYFIPDPWTNTKPSADWLSRAISSAVKQAVNDNSAGKINIKSYLQLLAGFVVYVDIASKLKIIRYILNSLGKNWRKAIVLDIILNKLHLNLHRIRRPNFSSIFFNAGAHIQHHYLFSSKVLNSPFKNPTWYIASEEDPIYDFMQIYDEIIGDYLKLNEVDIIVATGLSQKICEKPTYYYRLRNAKQFLSLAGIEFKSVVPLMTRDVIVNFSSAEESRAAEVMLNAIYIDDTNEKVFSEVDNRGMSIFLTLDLKNEVTRNTKIRLNGLYQDLKPLVVFVAIKNGEHQSKGYVYFSEKMNKFGFEKNSFIGDLKNVILKNYLT